MPRPQGNHNIPVGQYYDTLRAKVLCSTDGFERILIVDYNRAEKRFDLYEIESGSLKPLVKGIFKAKRLREKSSLENVSIYAFMRLTSYESQKKAPIFITEGTWHQLMMYVK